MARTEGDEMSAGTTIVRDLRRLWKPHKERLGQQQPDHPTGVRFHRACSWLDQAQQMDADQLGDLVLIEQWTALNALYGRWNEEQGEPVSDRQALRAFLESILTLDSSHHLVTVLQDHRGLVLAIVENAYLNGYFWDEPNEESRVRLSKSKFKAQSWYVEKRWLLLTELLLERIYLLRCQVVHGAATFGSKLNRKALNHCTLMLGHLLPAILRVWIDHGADIDWEPLCYPPQEQKVAPVQVRRPR